MCVLERCGLGLRTGKKKMSHVFYVNEMCWLNYRSFFKSSFWGNNIIKKYVQSTWEVLESDSVPWSSSTGRIEDLHLVWGAGTHDHGLWHHAPHLGWLKVTQQDRHAILHLHREEKVIRKEGKTHHYSKFRRILTILVKREWRRLGYQCKNTQFINLKNTYFLSKVHFWTNFSWLWKLFSHKYWLKLNKERTFLKNINSYITNEQKSCLFALILYRFKNLMHEDWFD